MDQAKQVIVVSGVSGTGKSTIGQALAAHLGGIFLDGDDYHPAENIAHMSNGQPLTDEMREGWLKSLCAAAERQPETYIIVACSALKKKYRNAFRVHFEHCHFALLNVSAEILRQRLAARSSHFMPVSLLESQLATLEHPQNDEPDVQMVDGTWPVEEIVAHLAKIGSQQDEMRANNNGA